MPASNWSFQTLLMAVENNTSNWEIPYDPAIAFLNIYPPKKIIKYAYKKKTKKN